MASSQTEHMQLNQWAAEDPVLREEFNKDNAKVDGVLNLLETGLFEKGNCSIFMGEYTGTGKAGAEYPNQLTFPFVPLLVAIARKDGMYASYQAIALQGQEHLCNFSCGSSDDSNICIWTGQTVVWYSETENVFRQLNEAENIYQYVAFGCENK